MKFKLDENFGSRTVPFLKSLGHDVETVLGEQLTGASDAILFEVCVREGRCLVTMDLDFADVVRFAPHRSAGIAVIRVPKNPSLDLLTRLVGNLVDAVAREPIDGRLWIVEIGRIRIHQDTSERLD